MERETARTGGKDALRGPDFICIGAQKAGTSWLGDVLRQRPDTWYPGVKELHYFNKAKNGVVPARLMPRIMNRFERKPKHLSDVEWPEGLAEKMLNDGLGRDEYFALFSLAPQDKLTWEITPAYSAMGPVRIDAMLEMLPNTKFIFIVRNAMSRMESSLRMALGRIPEPDPSPERIEEETRNWFHSFKSKRGNYAKYIPLWDERLGGTGRLLYLPFGMLKTDPAGMVRQVEGFLGLAPYANYRRLGQPFNTTKKIDLPAFAKEEIRTRMAPHQEFLRERFGEEFAALT